MPIKLALYDKSLPVIGDRLNALGLDLALHTFDSNGQLMADGRPIEPETTDIDYLWMSPLVSADRFIDGAFDLAMRTRKIGVLQTFNAGLDHPFYKRIAAKGTVLSNSSAQSVAISEFVLGQVLAAFQPILEQRAMQLRRDWKTTPFREISGTRWLIVGYGPIGREIAKRAKAFGAHITIVRRSPALDPAIDQAGTIADLDSYLPQSDVVVLACPLNTQTRGLAGTQFFARLKRGATLVNIARGGVVDEAALLAALDAGAVDTAILDVFNTEPLPQDHAFWSHPKIRITSHTSFAGSGGRGRWNDLFVDNIGRFARGEPMINIVNPNDLS